MLLLQPSLCITCRDLNAAVAEVRRVLVKNGYFVFSTCYPLAEGKLIRHGGKSAVFIRNYFKRKVVRWMEKLSNGSKVKMHSYYRTLQDYFDILIENNFVIERYLELQRLEENALPALARKKIKEDKEARQLYRIMEKYPTGLSLKREKHKLT